MDENITIQNDMQTDLQNNSFDSLLSDNPTYTDSDVIGYGVSVGNNAGTSGTESAADSTAGDIATSDSLVTGSDTLSVSSGDVVNADNMHISLSDLQTYQADTVENQIDYPASLGSIEEKIDNLNYNITALLFFIVFAWCYERIKNAVRSFNGVGLKQEETNMDNLIQFIIGDATTFTPACMVGLIVFCAILECIGSLAYNIMKAGR